MTEEQFDAAASMANRTVFARSIEAIVTSQTGNPVAGKLAADATSAAYKAIPAEVKCGAGTAAVGTVCCAAKVYTLGTVGSAAFAGSVIAAAPAVIVGGAAIGALVWLFKKLDS